MYLLLSYSLKIKTQKVMNSLHNMRVLVVVGQRFPPKRSDKVSIRYAYCWTGRTYGP